MNLKKKALEMKMDIPALFIGMKSRETPVAAKLVAGLAVAYALSPIDLIPDFIPVLGILDDLIILPALIALAIRLIPPGAFARYRKEAEGMWQNGRPKKWYFALPIAAVWLLAAWLVARAVFF